MTGTVYLGGGGDAQDERAVWELMLSRRPRVLYWPFALAPERLDAAEQWFTTSLRAHDPHLDVTTWKTLDGHHQDELDDVDLLFIGGGNTFDLLAHLRAHDALTWIHDHLRRGGDLYGGSAGAALAGATAAIATGHNPNTTGLTTAAELAGLGLLPQAVRPHYAPDLQRDVQRWVDQHGTDVVGIPETAGLVLVDGVATVVGTDPVWHLTSVSAVPALPGETFDVSTASH